MKAIMRSALLAVCLAQSAAADPAQVLGVAATEATDGSWRFDVTVAHPDTGWEHYADAWQVAAPDGTVLGLRELLHPHETEQPFTRSLSGVVIPDGVSTVLVTARCLTDGWTGEAMEVELPGR
jgi:hypothetical protein